MNQRRRSMLNQWAATFRHSLSICCTLVCRCVPVFGKGERECVSWNINEEKRVEQRREMEADATV